MTTTAAAPFDPNTNETDAYAVVADTAPMEFWMDFAEDTALVRRVILVRDYLRTKGYNPNLKVLRDTTTLLAGTNR